MAYRPTGYAGFPVQGISVIERRTDISAGSTHPAVIIQPETAYDYINWIETPGYVAMPEGNYFDGNDHGHRSSAKVTRSSSDSFYGTKSWGEWKGLLTDGWTDGAKSANKLAEELVPMLYGLRSSFELEHDYEGDEVDIDRYLEGEPECMLAPEEIKVHGQAKFLDVGIALSVHAGIHQKALAWRGIISAAIVDVLEANGYRCSVFTYELSRGRKGDFMLKVPVKQHDQPVDMERLATLIGHPSAFRRAMFSALEKLPKNKFYYYACDAYGYPIHNLPTSVFPADLYIGNECLVNDAQSAYNQFKEKLSELPDFRQFLIEQGVVDA